MVSVRLYRDEDFGDLVRMFDETWGWELKGPKQENVALASLYIALALIGSDVVYVAQIDGKVQGVACLQFSQKQKTESVDSRGYDVSSYMLVAQSLQKQLQQTQTGRYALDFYERLEGVNGILLRKLRENSVDWDAELKLLLTSPQSRGQGVGKALVEQVFDELRRRKTKTCMLRTDTHCAWQYYEKTDWRRAAEYVWPDEADLTALAYVKAVV